MRFVTNLFTFVHSNSFAVLGVMVLIQTPFAHSFLTQLEPSFVEPTSYGNPPLPVIGSIASLQSNVPLHTVKAPIFVVSFNQYLITGCWNKVKELCRIWIVWITASGDVGFGRIAGQREITKPALSCDG